MKNKNHFFKLIVIFMAIGALVVFSSTPVFSQPNVPGDQQIYSPDDENDDVAPKDIVPEWGGTNISSFPIYGTGFVPVRGNDASYKNFTGNRTYCNSACILNGIVQLPQGARLYGFEFDAYDAGASSASLYLWRCPYNGGSCSLLGSVSTIGSPGYQFVTRTVSGTIDNYHYYYFFENRLPGSSAYGIVGALARYRLQVNTALPNPFNDIGGLNSRFQNAIKALAASGITKGCTANSYCPFSPITRGEMAVFLAEALGLHWPN